ncbi:MAG: CPBP family intramembrane metalloprotease [Burkholderiales bacterium]|nr:CPBP family intramembrane metalloprotease [Burkholderiales bacterium]
MRELPRADGDIAVAGMLPPERVPVRVVLRRLAWTAPLLILPIVATGVAVSWLTGKLGLDGPLPAALTSAVVAVLAYRQYVRRVEARPVAEFWARGAVREITAGALLGGVLFATVIAVLALAGSYTIAGRGSATDVVTALGTSVAAAVTEEIVFRGIVFRFLESAAGSTVALGVSAALFGALHFLSPNATVLGLVAVALEAGVLLACAYALTRRLWLPIGLHAAWNFVQGGIFGVAVSGTRAQGVFVGSLSGPEWLTGGIFGPEASLVSVVLCLAVAATLWRQARRAGHLLPRTSPRT